MKRKIYERLLEWKARNGKTALFIQGARRVGKSYIAEAFGKNEYKSYIIIDFNRAGDYIRDLFMNDLEDTKLLFAKLSAYYSVTLYERNSLIILDEIQMFPRARTAVKYLVEDGRYDIVETGSLASVKENVKDILIPSEEEKINLYPMDYEEFLMAMGNDAMIDLIRTCFKEKKPMGQALHRKAMEYYRQYLLVGGMPQAVSEFSQTADFKEVDRIKRRILTLYRDDIRKLAKGYEFKVEAIFDEIPTELKNQNRHFNLASLKKGARFSEYKDSLFWLSDAMIVNNCFSSNEPNIGLSLNLNRTLLKCYLADTGLLISHVFNENEIISEEIYKKVLYDKLEVNLGMIIENAVAQALVSSGHSLFFYTNPSKENADDRMEIDFLIAKDSITGRHNICPIEVKSSTRYTLSSINKFRKKYANQTGTPYVIHPADYKEEDGIVYVPLYMAHLL